ncbi:MAG: hypothetical protein GC150_11830 [Rhizobiales bacterium]|nr:hypothetical protein [Hyphomicrobiales bacterium]
MEREVACRRITSELEALGEELGALRATERELSDRRADEVARLDKAEGIAARLRDMLDGFVSIVGGRGRARRAGERGDLAVTISEGIRDSVRTQQDIARAMSQAQGHRRNIERIDRQLASIERQISDKRRNVASFQSGFSSHRCGELGYPWHVLNIR